MRFFIKQIATTYNMDELHKHKYSMNEPSLPVISSAKFKTGKIEITIVLMRG